MGSTEKLFIIPTPETMDMDAEQRRIAFEVAMRLADFGLVGMDEVAVVCESGVMPMAWLERLAEVSAAQA